MTPENWPEPIGRVVELSSLEAVDIHVEEMPDVGETIYTATQVREIVAAETAQIKLDADEMVRQIGSAAELGLEYAQSELTNHDQSYDRHPSTEGGRSAITSDISEIKTAINDACKWLKETE